MLKEYQKCPNSAWLNIWVFSCNKWSPTCMGMCHTQFDCSRPSTCYLKAMSHTQRQALESVADGWLAKLWFPPSQQWCIVYFIVVQNSLLLTL